MQDARGLTIINTPVLSSCTDEMLKVISYRTSVHPVDVLDFLDVRAIPFHTENFHSTDGWADVLLCQPRLPSVYFS